MSFYSLIDPSSVLLNQDLMNGRKVGGGVNEIKGYKLPVVRYMSSRMSCIAW